jgi:hypothetical protein
MLSVNTVSSLLLVAAATPVVLPVASIGRIAAAEWVIRAGPLLAAAGLALLGIGTLWTVAQLLAGGGYWMIYP